MLQKNFLDHENFPLSSPSHNSLLHSHISDSMYRVKHKWERDVGIYRMTGWRLLIVFDLFLPVID